MSNRDWNGNNNSIWKTLGASNHTDKERQNEDYYATTPEAAEWLLKLETFKGPIWECASGENHLAKVFEEHGFTVRKSDIVKRADDTEIVDFLSDDITEWNGDIITNPPYNKATEFVEKAMDIIPDGQKVAMFLKLQFLEGKKRRDLFKKYPPKTVWVSSSRLMCAKNGDFETMIAGGGSAVAYIWLVFEKGYKGDTIVKWFN